MGFRGLRFSVLGLGWAASSSLYSTTPSKVRISGFSDSRSRA